MARLELTDVTSGLGITVVLQILIYFYTLKSAPLPVGLFSLTFFPPTILLSRLVLPRYVYVVMTLDTIPLDTSKS